MGNCRPRLQSGAEPVADGAMPGGRMPGGRMPGVDDVVPGAEGEALEVGDSGLVELVGVGGMLVVGRGAVVLGAELAGGGTGCGCG